LATSTTKVRRSPCCCCCTADSCLRLEALMWFPHLAPDRRDSVPNLV